MAGARNGAARHCARLGAPNAWGEAAKGTGAHSMHQQQVEHLAPPRASAPPEGAPPGPSSRSSISPAAGCARLRLPLDSPSPSIVRGAKADQKCSSVLPRHFRASFERGSQTGETESHGDATLRAVRSVQLGAADFDACARAQCRGGAQRHGVQLVPCLQRSSEGDARAPLVCSMLRARGEADARRRRWRCRTRSRNAR